MAESYDAIKRISPHTRVMVIFRYVEMNAKKGYHPIEKFDREKIDVLGFTTYPRFPSPADIPDDYYRPIIERTGDVPVAFTEIGRETKPGDPGAQEGQAEFLLWFLRYLLFKTYFVCTIRPPPIKSCSKRQGLGNVLDGSGSSGLGIGSHAACTRIRLVLADLVLSVWSLDFVPSL